MASKHKRIESEREQLATLGRCLTRLQRIGASTWREDVELAQAWRTLERLERQARAVTCPPSRGANVQFRNH